MTFENIKCENANEAFVKGLVLLKEKGSLINSRGFKAKESLFVSFEIRDPTQITIQVPGRKFNEDYAVLEWLWYLNADPSVFNIGKFASIWNDISDFHGEVESNYGVYLKTQWHWVINELLNDPDSRRATLAINQPSHKNKNKKDYPCTQYIHFFIRENKLHLQVSMRSNDAVFGFCNDVFTFCLFQQLMKNELNSRGLNVELGNYYHSAGSFHIYERHYNMMEKVCKNYYVKCKKDGYPLLKKHELKPEFVWSVLDKNLKFLSVDSPKESLENMVKSYTKWMF
ncbi:MAG: hypothetical protein CL885_00390 [Dehalococcoidia bacterium]|nr:hypothetical protein [Dehalococcoidia bacterium]